MDGRWQPTTDSTEAVYFRLITYQDDKPVGLTADYYRNGKKQYEGTLLGDRPLDVQDGLQTWYYPSGEKRIVEHYKKGEPVGDLQVFLRSGTTADENWIAHYRSGEKFSDEKKYEASADEFLIALENAESFFSRESEEYANIADWLGIVYGIQQKHGEAIHYKEEFVAVRKLIRPAPDTLMVSTLADLGAYYKLEKNWPIAKRKLKEFLGYNARYFHGSHPRFAEAIQTLGTVCEALHEYADALDYLTEAKKVFDADPDPYEVPRLSNIFSLSSLYLTIGEFTKGELLLTTELKYLKKKYGEKSEYYITALGSLARIHLGGGLYILAEKEGKEQLALIKSIEGDQSEAYAAALGSLAELYGAWGDLPRADRSIQQARKIYENKGSADAAYLEFLQKLSLIYGMMGNRRALMEITIQRKNLAVKLFGNASLPYARTLISLTDIAFLEKHWSVCEELAREAVSIYAKYDIQSLSEQEKTSLAILKSQLATIYLMQHLSAPSPEKLASAQQRVEDAIRIFESMPEKGFSMEITDTYLTLAMIHECKQETQLADRYYQDVLRKVRKQFGEMHPYLIEVLFLIAKKSEIRKDYAASFKYYQQAIHQHHQYIQQVFPYLSETEKEQFYASNKLMLTGFQGFASQYHSKVPGLAEEWCNLVLVQKGIILESFHPIRDAIFASGDKALQNLFNNWQTTKNEYARLLQQTDPNTDVSKQKISERLNELEKQISSKSKSLNFTVGSASITWKDVQKSLGPGEAAVEIVYTVEDREEGYDTAYHALIIKTGIKEPLVVRLAEAKQLEGKAFKFYRNSIAVRLEDLVSYHLFWKPLNQPLEGIRIIYFAADGIYHQISLPALFNPDTKKYLSDEKYIVAMPSTSWIVLKKKNPQTLTEATFFAHPDYGATVSARTTNMTRSLDLDNISDLAGTQKELSDLVTLLSSHHIRYYEFDGGEATEEKLKQVKQPSVLHIATHGYFIPAAISTNDQFQNPLLQSGLLMAGCQRKPHLTDPAKDDGILTAYEASTLPLYNTMLVVLSACETGLGEVKNGEGVYGLQRAFFMAGAQRLLMSQWKVDDEATQQFMVAFYEQWIKNGTIDQAYQLAQQAVKADHPEPYYWAAFVLNGFN